MRGAPHTVVVVGLAFEARIAAGSGVAVIGRVSGDDLSVPIGQAIEAGCRGIISFGIAGGLSPRLRAGDCVIASGIADGERIWPACSNWSAKLLTTIRHAHHGVIAGADMPVVTPESKSRLHKTTGAVAVDMESHLAARLAAMHDIPFVALRVVADPAHRHLPHAAIVGVRADGRSDVPAVLRALARRPKSLLPLLRVAGDVAAARVELSRGRAALGPGFALFDEATLRSPSAWSGLRSVRSARSA